MTTRQRRQPFAAVNLISDPIHGYIELTKRLAPDESAAAGLPAETVAEEDLLDTAWLQRLRRISQLQSARWVFPTAEHSRFTHGLGVMHEAGLWARSLYPRPPGGRSERAVRGPRRRDDADGGAPPRRGSRAVRPLLRRPRAGGLPRARRPAPPARQGAHPRGPEPADHRGRARAAAARPAPGAGCRRRARRLRRRRGDRPALGRVPHRQAGPDRRIDAGLGALARAAPVRRVHRRQPRLRPPRRVPHRRRGRDRGRGPAAPLYVHQRARPDAVRAGARRARDVPHRPPIPLPAGLFPPHGARDRPRPRVGLPAVGPGDLRRRVAGGAPVRVRRPRRVRPAPPGGPLGARRGRRRRRRRRRAGRWARLRGGRRRWRAILLRQPTWRAEAEIRAEYEAGDRPDALIATLGEADRGRTAIDLAIVDARPADAGSTDALLALEARDGRSLSLAAALGSIPAYWLIGRRYRKVGSEPA